MYERLESKSLRAEVARERLKLRVSMGAKQQMEVLTRVMSTTVVDRLVYPTRMSFVTEPSPVGSGRRGLYIRYRENDGSQTTFRVHDHALGQLAGATRPTMPIRFAKDLREGEPWAVDLCASILNTMYGNQRFVDRYGEPKQFLHRLVSGELRGFLTSTFNPHLTTAHLIKPFIEACADHQAGPVEAHTSDVRVTLKCCMPYIFEPYAGEFVAFGSTFSNSDFGAGMLKICLTSLRISSGTVSVLEDGYKRVHLGPMLRESDIRVDDEAALKERQAFVQHVRSAVNNQLSEQSISTFLSLIRTANDHQLEWYRLRSTLKRVLREKEIDVVEQLLQRGGDEIIDLPKPQYDQETGDPVATAWWAANVLGWLAGKEEDVDRKQDIQALAGQLVSPAGRKVDQEAA
jgi:hypothetical protein